MTDEKIDAPTQIGGKSLTVFYTIRLQVVELLTYGVVDTFTIVLREGSAYSYWEPQSEGHIGTAPSARHPALQALETSYHSFTRDKLHLGPKTLRDEISKVSVEWVTVANEALLKDSMRIV